MKDTTWQDYRNEIYAILGRGADALFSFADTLLSES
jgi:hypothetical protein